WGSATATDGSLDSPFELFSFTIELTSGSTNKLLIRATDESNNTATPINKWFTVPATCEKITVSPGGGGGGGGGGSSGRLRALCGNFKCEIGENSENCPLDCTGLSDLSTAPPYSVETNLIDVILHPGESTTYSIWISNNQNKTKKVNISVIGKAAEFIDFYGRGKVKLSRSDVIELKPRSTEPIEVRVSSTDSTRPGLYTGDIQIKIDGDTQVIPVTVMITLEKEGLLDVKLEAITKEVMPGKSVKFHVSLYNLGVKERFDVHMIYKIIDVATEKLITQKEEEMAIETSLSYIKEISFENVTIVPGKYFIEAEAVYENKTASSADVFEFIKPFWTATKKTLGLLLLLLVVSAAGGYKARQMYITKKLEKSRYIHESQYENLPKGPMWMGKIAETDIRAEFDPKDLKTHCIVVGATGSGKSVAASVFIEELLDMKIPVVVFDPTAQWTGFVRPCRDEDFFKVYEKFGMKREDAKPYRGVIYEVTDPKITIDFKKYMNPGEITIFTLNNLKPGEYDQAVMSIVDQIFQIQWEESTDLKLAIVFDEIHRLHEKYGGKGGYIALEKGAREFRKWGIGLLLVSQIIADFKEELLGNVLTELQLHTKSATDVQRVKEKYGEEFAKKLPKLEIGVGMMQNPKFNNGRPFFLNIRPVKHEAHKIPDKELQTYKKFEEILSDVEKTIGRMKTAGVDTFDIDLEFKLALDKLKEGRFKMAEMYTESLLESLKRYEKKSR
ncbi:MAG: DUF87 domain-containing protein, partial [Candidatus Hydrothermarchaeaceae archaeon]